TQFPDPPRIIAATLTAGETGHAGNGLHGCNDQNLWALLRRGTIAAERHRGQSLPGSEPSPMFEPSAILITGASSGIGEALARHYPGPGKALALAGRDGRRLAAVAEFCRGRGASVFAQAFDVTDQAATAAFVDRAEAAAPLELVIANAGISAGAGFLGESPE